MRVILSIVWLQMMDYRTKVNFWRVVIYAIRLSVNKIEWCEKHFTLLRKEEEID